MKFFKQRFAGAPEGTAALFFIVSRLLPAALDRYPRGLTGHVAHPSRSIVSRLLPAALDRYNTPPESRSRPTGHALTRDLPIRSAAAPGGPCSPSTGFPAPCIHPSRSVQIFSTVGFAALYSTSLC
jgi:hypothetical protein